MTRVSKFAKTGLALAGALAVSPLSVLAQDNQVKLNLPTGTSFENVTTWNATRLLGATINLILVLAGIVAFVWLLYGGLQWILAGGDKEGTEKARKRITAALIGLVIIFSVYALVFLLSEFLGVNLVNFTIKNV